jgi:hypothetical protein
MDRPTDDEKAIFIAALDREPGAEKSRDRTGVACP